MASRSTTAIYNTSAIPMAPDSAAPIISITAGKDKMNFHTQTKSSAWHFLLVASLVAMVKGSIVAAKDSIT